MRPVGWTSRHSRETTRPSRRWRWVATRPHQDCPVGVDAVSAEATIPAIGFTEYVELQPPPVDRAATASGNGVAFTLFTVPPRLQIAEEIQKALGRGYPAPLRDAGLGGTVSLLVHIDQEGTVLDA